MRNNLAHEGPPIRRAFAFGTRPLPAGLLLATLVCFVLPWFAVSLSGSELTRFTGLELTFGTRFSSTSPAAFLGEVRAQLGAEIAMGGTVAALILLSLLRGRAAVLLAAAAATVAAAGLLASGMTFHRVIKANVSSVLVIRYAVGYYLAVLLTLAGAVSLALSGMTTKSDN